MDVHVRARDIASSMRSKVPANLITSLKIGGDAAGHPIRDEATSQAISILPHT